MKAEELMIGDCVNDGSSNIQITGTQLFDLYMGYMDEPQPIPLTAEVLEANGFAQAIVCDEEVYELGECPELSYYPDRSVFNISTETNEVLIFCIYVHELQHALRLCGLNDSANNFKIN